MFSLSELEDMEYRKVTVHGKFDHSKELYLAPRTLLAGTDRKQDSRVSSGGGFGRPGPKPGAIVITAFEVSSDQHPKCVTFLSLIIVILLACKNCGEITFA